MRLHKLAILAVVATLGCGGDDGDTTDPPDPLDVQFGDTALVVVINPVVNDATDKSVPEPGSELAGIEFTSDDGVSATSDMSGIAVLADLTAGMRTIAVVGDNIDASFQVSMTAGELREIALAADGGRAEVMVQLDYKSQQVAMLDPTMTNEQVNDALSVSDTVVFFAGGIYEGNLDFSGSRTTLFGEGVFGGEVTIDGDVTMSGSDSRIRGTLVTGDLQVPASGTGLSFSRVDGNANFEGSDSTILQSELCGSAQADASGAIALGVTGLSPAGGCN